MHSKKHYPAFTGLRGLFIMIIVLHHLLPETELISAIPMTSFLTHFGGILGNSLFFMLSGFLLSLGYQERIQSGAVSFGSYMKKRLTRLYPLFVVTNLLGVLVSILNYGPSVVNVKRIAFSFLLQAGAGIYNTFPYNGTTWFVSGLLVCYIVYFFIAYHAKSKTAYCALTTFFVILGYTFSNVSLSIPYCYPETGIALKNFFIGCLLAQLLPYFTAELRRWLEPTSLLTLAVFGFMLLKYGVEIISGGFGDALSFMLLPTVIFIASGNGFIAKILASKPMTYLGNISISIFFWHMVIYDYVTYFYKFFFDLEATQNLHFLISLVLIMAFCMILHPVFQKKKWV